MSALPRNVLYYGSETPLPGQTHLRAGPLTAIFEEGDLRYIRFGDREILRRVTIAIRDRNWGTVAPQLANVRLQVDADAFQITYDVANRQGEIDFAWKGRITGDASGTITFAMDGEARSTFYRSRIGFCVLHPIRECAGEPCRVEHADGSIEEGRFPKTISPHQPFFDMRAITHQVAPGLAAEVRFEGDLFEMEDHRNWTDASYKTYCTPLALPYPVEVPQGTRVVQSVTVQLLGDERATTNDQRPSTADKRPILTVGAATFERAVVPGIGLGIASHGLPLTKAEASRLAALNLSHLRIDLRLSEGGWDQDLRRAVEEATAIGGPALAVALHLSDDAEQELARLVTLLQELRPRVCAWHVFHIGEKSTSERWLRLARERLAAYDPAVPIVGGTDAYFAELNRGRPPVAALDQVGFSINPQVHAFDNASLVETLEAQAETMASAREFVGGRPTGADLPFAVGPVTLQPRFNPNATSPEPEPGPDELPSAVDPRQMSLFGAGWTIGSLKYLSRAGGVASITYYETTGWRGVMETEAGSPKPALFRSIPGAVFPLYHVLADVGEFAGGEVLPVTTSHPLRVDGLALRHEGRTRVLIANLSPETQTLFVDGLAACVGVRVMDETNVEEAMRGPEAFRERDAEVRATVTGKLELELRPYAIATIDAA